MAAKAFILQLIDSDIQDRLIFLGRIASDSYREIGDLTVKICTRLDEIKIQALQGRYLPSDAAKLAECGYMDVYKVVGELVGKSTRTIRYYSQVCRFYTDETWAAYDLLPFSHFEFAMTLGERWRDVLNASIEQMDNNGGRPPSVDWLEANFSGCSQVQSDLNRIQAQNEADRIYENISDLAAVQESDPPAVDDRGRMVYALRLLARIVKPLESYLENNELPGPVVAALRGLFQALREALTTEAH